MHQYTCPAVVYYGNEQLIVWTQWRMESTLFRVKVMGLAIHGREVLLIQTFYDNDALQPAIQGGALCKTC